MPSPVVNAGSFNPDLYAVAKAAANLTLSTTAVGQMTATNSPTSWSITAGNASGYFAIDNNGSITITNPTGQKGLIPTTYTLTIQATNASGSGSNTATITVANLSGNVYYVATTGNDTTGTGTISLPWATIHNASFSVAPGDIVFVRVGTYTPSVSNTFHINGGGNASKMVIYEPYNSEAVILNASGYSTDDGVTLSASYVQFQGFEVASSAGGSGIVIWNNHDCVIAYCYTHGHKDSGIFVGGTAPQGSSYNQVIIGNTISNNVQGASSLSDSMTIRLTATSVVIGNTSFNARANAASGVAINWSASAGGAGLNPLGTVGNLLTQNVCYDYPMIYINGCNNITVDRNLLYLTNSVGYTNVADNARDGIACSIETNEVQYVPAHYTITNNIMIGTRTGFIWFNSAGGDGLTQSLIANNTIINCAAANIHLFDTSGFATGNLVKNNIFYQTGAGTQTAGTVSGYTFSNNCWFSSSGFSGTGDVTSDPLFMGSIGSVVATAYQLQTSSPCIRAGADVTNSGITGTLGTDHDYSGNGRPLGRFDIGVYQIPAFTVSTQYQQPINMTA